MDPRLWRAAPAARPYLAGTVFCGAIIAACAIGAAVLTGHLVAAVVTEPDRRDPDAWTAELLGLAALWFLRALTQWVQGRLGQRGAAAAVAELSAEVLRSVTALPPNALPDHRDEAAALLSTGIDGLRSYFTGYLPALVLAAFLTPATIVVLTAVDLRSALIVMVALPLIPIFMVLIGVATAQRSAAALEALTTLHARLMDLIAGIPTLRALGRADGPAARVGDLADAHRRTTMSTLRIAFLSAFVLELVATLGVALVAVGIGLRLVTGGMTLAAGLTALLLAPEVFWPLRRVGAEFHAAQDGTTAADKAFAMIDAHRPERPGTRTAKAAGATILVDSLSVSTRDGLAPARLSARIGPGRLTVLSGANGAGKTTTLQAIAGLVAPTRGRVSVDGLDIAELEPQAWWRQLSWLAQRPVLVPGTVLANLNLFGDLADLTTACRAARFDDVVAGLPDGLKTLLGRGGVGLSLGQRQRLGLARALGSPAELLLLDEPTAHLDEETELEVVQALKQRARAGSTVVAVSHRASLLAAADMVIEVEAESRAVT